MEKLLSIFTQKVHQSFVVYFALISFPRIVLDRNLLSLTLFRFVGRVNYVLKYINGEVAEKLSQSTECNEQTKKPMLHKCNGVGWKQHGSTLKQAS
ncbi:CLUMA_CG001666, isoform A [Clunio marinus]|uniref:CLUMA_CG001666, isoform A n=1 Tax=Clunio marinus TaxID=568069 RepID=A0A1J1HIL2_9DIPT|nr:CLUMA_CG001666, isoform A [Clunio marinus]